MKKNRKRLLLILVILFLTAAGIIFLLRHFSVMNLFGNGNTSELASSAFPGGNAPNSLFFNFESDTTGYDKKAFYKGNAHSGHLSAKAFGKNSFSFSINRSVTEIGLQYMKSVSLSAWVYIFKDDDPVNATLVFSGFNGQNNICWQGISLGGNDLPMGEWFKVSGRFDLSNVPFTNDSRVQVYFWNNSPTDILVDDIYISFGGSTERKGDTTLVDLTGGTYDPKFNYPPFRTAYFSRQETGKADEGAFIAGSKSDENKPGPEDKVVCGRFSPAGTEQIIVAGRGTSAGIYSFCSSRGKFVKTPAVIPAELISAEKIMKFSVGNKDLLFVTGKQGPVLLECSPLKDVCNPPSERAGFRTLWSGNLPGSEPGMELIAADLDNDRNSELTGAGKNGWKVWRFASGKWIVIASSSAGDDSFIRNGESFRLSSGKFMQKMNNDLILVIGQKGYDLLRFDLSQHRFVSCFKGKNGGVTIGLDTLRMTDQFITGDFENNGSTKVFRYNRDWRYDLKEISFSDSTFRIISWIDFTGFEQDHNPKYAEILKILPGMYLKQGNTSLLLIQQNPSSQMMPDAIGVYNYQK